MKSKMFLLLGFGIICVVILYTLQSSRTSQQTEKKVNVDLTGSMTKIEQKINELQKKLIAKDNDLSETKTTMQNLEDKVLNLQNMIKEYNQSQTSTIDQLDFILKKMPQLSVKKALVEQVTVKNGIAYAKLDYVEMLGGDEAAKAIMEDTHVTRANAEDTVSHFTNGYYIRNKQIEHDQIEIDEGAEITMIDEHANSKYIPYADYIKNTELQVDKLFTVYRIGDKIILLTEVYRP
ncbi:MAG: hypothetical protein JWM44_2573 [Bacilli bacterium]|nr:hypothetical protein [Bacilli bacterium]